MENLGSAVGGEGSLGLATPLGRSSLLVSRALPPAPAQSLDVAFQAQVFLPKPFPLLPPSSPSAWNACLSWQGPDASPINLCSKREGKKCKKQILPAGQARGAVLGPGSETAPAGSLPDSTGAGVLQGLPEEREPQQLGWRALCPLI